MARQNQRVARQSAVSVRREQRPGEGVFVDIIRQGDEGSYKFRADFSDLPVPTRNYVADFTGMSVDQHNTVRILLGQRKVVGDGLRSLLVLHMPGDDIVRFVDSLNPMMERSSGARSQLPSWTLKQPLLEEPAQTVALSATIALAGFSGSLGCLDFYQASPFSIHRVREGASKLGLDPVVRVSLPTAALFALLDEMIRVAPELNTVKGDLQ